LELSSDPLFPTPQWRVAWAGRKLVVWSVAVFGSRLQGDVPLLCKLIMSGTTAQF